MNFHDPKETFSAFHMKLSMVDDLWWKYLFNLSRGVLISVSHCTTDKTWNICSILDHDQSHSSSYYTRRLVITNAILRKSITYLQGRPIAPLIIWWWNWWLIELFTCTQVRRMDGCLPKWKTDWRTSWALTIPGRLQPYVRSMIKIKWPSWLKLLIPGYSYIQNPIDITEDL